jgi:hypothetical protein
MQLKLAAAEAAEEYIPTDSRLFLIRREMLRLSSALASEAENPFSGQAPIHTFGPFLGGMGQEVWFDEFLVGAGPATLPGEGLPCLKLQFKCDKFGCYWHTSVVTLYV